MAKSGYKSVDAYIAAQPDDVQPILERIRAIIRKAVPDAEEGISYKIPAYKLHGGPVLFFAAWKEHYSIYPATDGIAETFKKELAPYKISKGTIRFPLDEPVPVNLIERIATFRAKILTERAKAKRSAKKKRPT